MGQRGDRRSPPDVARGSGHRQTNDQEAGNVTEVAGFFFDHVNEMMHDLFVDLNYQHGGKLYRDNGKEVALDEAPGLDAINMVNDMYQSGVSGFGESLAFPAGQQVMLYSYAWRQQQIMRFDDVRWTVAPLPTLDGDLHPNMQRMQYYFGMAVPKDNAPDEIHAAFEFLNWAYTDDGRLMDLNSRSGTLPARMALWGDPEIVSNPVLNTLTQTLPYATTPGEFPKWMMTALGQVRTAITAGHADPGVMLGDITRQINTRLTEQPITWFAE